MRTAIVGIEINRLLEISNGLLVIFRCAPAEMLPTAQEGIIGCWHLRLLLTDELLLFVRQSECQGIRNAMCHLILQDKDLGERSVISVGPNVSAGESINELSIDPQLVAGTLDASFEHVSDTEFFPNRTQI